ncbi:MAG: glycosyltransferase family 4 protein [Acidimicrobiales bacterium]
MAAEPPPLRVLGISASSLISGAERVLLRCARLGRRSDYGRWTIACPPGPFAEAIEAEAIDHVPLPDLKLGTGHKAWAGARLAGNNIRAAVALRRLAPQFDVVVVNSVMALPTVRLGIPSATPVVWLVHDVITRPDLRRIVQVSKSAVDLAIGVSNAAAALPGQLGLETAVVRNGVHFPVAPCRPQTEPPIVGLNAMLTSWKGQKEFLLAMQLVDAPFEIELLGGTFPKDADYERMLRELADQPPLQGRVRFLGHLDDPIEAMRRWSVAVSASIEPEAGPLAVLEAMSIGLPVVVTNHGGAPEIAGDVGLLAEPGDACSMAAAVERLLRCPEEREERGRQGREIIETRHGLEEGTDRFAALLRQVVDAG